MKITECHGDIRNPIRLGNAKITASDLASHFKQVAEDRGVPITVRADSIRSGGMLFGSDYPCVIISHPNPPASYFDIVVIISGNAISFKYAGYSKANYNHNRKEDYRNQAKQGSLSGMLKGAFVNDDVMALQDEAAWQSEVLDIIETIVE